MSITPLPAAPVVSDSTPVFNAKAFAVVQSLGTFVDELNVQIPIIGAAVPAASSALAAANFKGEWTALTGALTIPASVSYNGKVWLLSQNVANVTTEVPGASTKWIPLFGKLPVGTTAQRPASPAFGDVYANSTTGDLEWYDPSTSGWKKFSQPSGYSVNYLVVAGGAGGGSGTYSGGGGAGGLLTGSTTLIAGVSYTITVGSGGAASASGTSSSIASAITALGGGSGGAQSAAGTPGGSGGGAGNGAGNGSFAGGSGTSGQGYAGGSTPPSGPNSGGGGGSSAAGVSPANGAVVGGAGGAGTSNSISGSAVTYATGGSGVTTGAATNGASNTGNGGTGNSGTGGSGIVIISYLGSQRGTGGTVTTAGGYTIHTFTSSGTFNATGIPIGSGVLGTNNIGVAGQPGFGVGICPGPLPSGMTPLSNYMSQVSDNYGNYQYSDGSVMVWVPAFFYKWGTGANGLALNAVDIQPFSAYATVADANTAGYALHRAFYDGGVQPGFFVDKYLVSNNSGIASSLRNGIVITTGQRGSLSTAVNASLTGAPENTLGGCIAAAKTRGANFFASSRFIFAALAMLSYAHAKASSSTTYCAWYHATNNFPKGNNNDALGDAQDAAILYVADGNGTYLGCGKTGSANLFARTTHNGMNSGVADLNGLVWEFTPGLTSDATNLYVLKTTVRMKDVTGSNTLATDLFGATGIAALYDSLGTTYEALWTTAANRTIYFGNAASQVFSAVTSGNAWNYAGLGAPLAAGIGGVNAFGNDGLYDYKPNELAPSSGGYWNTSSNAGVWAFGLGDLRASSSGTIGFRSACYL